MDTLLRDPVWQFIGAFVSFVALVASIYFFIRQRNKKKLSYQVTTETNLLRVNSEIKGKVKILYEDTPLQNAYLIGLTIVNDGNVSIVSSDFERPLSFDFGPNANVISAEIVETSPKSLKPKLLVSSGQATLEPMLLNSRDTISIKILVAQYGGEVKSDARIVGVKDLKILSAAPVFTPAVLVQINRLVAIVFVASFVALIIYSSIGGEAKVPEIIPIVFVFTLGYFGSALVAFWVRQYRGEQE